jgi:DNA repair protein SbcC/Rad50
VSLDLEGFRGANKRIHLDFGENATVLSAWNGRGKSTLLGAVEWALWGELRFQASENLTHDELNSMLQPAGRATVQLALSTGGREVLVRREKAVRKRETWVEVTDPSGGKLEGSDADSFIFRMTGLSFDDFYRAAFLHQESIRGLLTEDQKVRDEALDRLFGVEKIRDILTAIRPKPITTALGEIEATEAKLTARLAGAGDVAETVRTRAREEALELGYTESELTTEQGAAEATTLQSGLVAACEEYGQAAPAIVPVEAIDDVDKVVRRVKATVTEIRLSVGKESPLDAAIGRITDLRRLRADITAASDDVEKAHAELRDQQKEHGSSEDWAHETARLNELIGRTEVGLHVLDVHGRVITDAITFLEAVPTAKECPVCGEAKEAKKLAALLRTKVAKDQAAEVVRLNREKEKASERLAILTDLERERLRLSQTRDRKARELGEARDTAWRVLGKKGEVGDVVAETELQEKALDGRLEGLRNLNHAREAKLKALVDGADRLRTLQRFVKADQDFARVREKSEAADDGGAKSFEEEKASLLTLKTDIEAIVVALNGLATGRAAEALARCGEDISQTYSRLCNHPYFDGLKIDLAQKAVQGVQRNTYRIIAYSTKDGQRTSASSRLSTAQMNCVALSAYLSLSKVLNHNLGFMLLDDPSQNLDGEHKVALAAELRRLEPGLQLVIGTHDAEFDQSLRKQLGESGVSWFDLSWTPKDGTSVKSPGRST